MTEPFNPACFSFDKAKQNEILFILGYDEEKKHFNVYNNVWLSVSIKGRPRMRNVMKNLHFIVISMVWRVGIQRTWIVSPVAKNQHLYVPNPTKHYAQVFFFFFLWFHRFTILIFCIIFCPFSISFRVPIMHYSSIRMFFSSSLHLSLDWMVGLLWTINMYTSLIVESLLVAWIIYSWFYSRGYQTTHSISTNYSTETGISNLLSNHSHRRNHWPFQRLVIGSVIHSY